MNELNDQIKSYIEQLNESGKRSRTLFYLLSISLIISFITFLDGFKNSWTRSRYEQLVTVKNYVELKMIQDSANLDLEDVGCLNFQLNSISWDSTDTIEGKIKEYLKARDEKIINYGDLRQDFEIHAGLYKDMLSVDVPFLGITFDFNYLPVFTGLCLSLVLFIFVFSLEKEKMNLVITRNYILKNGGGLTGYYYKLSTMGQILHVTPLLLEVSGNQELIKTGKMKGISRVTQYSIYFPAILYPFSILYYNTGTAYERGITANPYLFFASLIVEFILFLLIFYLSYAAYKHYKGIGLLWMEFHAQVSNPPKEALTLPKEKKKPGPKKKKPT